MKFLLVSLVVVSFALLSMSIVQNVEARGADEPCSYLKPHEWTRDSSGNCVRISSVPVTSNSPVTGRSVNEPCSYLNRTLYVRDPHTGLCHQVIIQAPTPVKTSPSVVSASTYSAASILPVNTDSIITSIDLPTVDSTPITYLFGLGFVAFIGFLGYKIWKRIKRPSQDGQTDFHHISHTVQNRFLQLRDEDPDLFLHEINAKLKKYSKRGNELYEANGILPDKKKLKILKYRDPSTDRIYISFVPEHFTDPDDAMAWKFNITKQQYQNLVDEG